MVYVANEWRDADPETPLSAERLTRLENGVVLAHDAVRDLSDLVEKAGAGIAIVNSTSEAELLPEGTLYVIAGKPDVVIVSSNSGNLTSTSFTPELNGGEGNKVLLAVNTRAVSDMTVSPPDGFQTLVDGYWAGTQRSWVFAGDYASDLTVSASGEAEFAWSAVVVSGAASYTVGSVKSREEDPAESNTVTAPAHTGSLVLGVAFERTTAGETADDILLNEGWSKVEFAAQGANVQTVLVARGGEGDMIATYPNEQATNGTGVQVAFHA